METQNPYSAPQAHPESVAQHDSTTNALEITPKAITSLIGMRTWIKLIALTMGLTSVVFCIAIFKIDSIGGFGLIQSKAIYVLFVIGIIAPLVISIIMISYSSKIKAYCETKSDNDFRSLSNSQGKLFITLSSVCIISVIAFIIAVYALFQIQKDYQESRQRAQYESYSR